MAEKTEPFQAIGLQFCELGKDCAVHVMPSGEVAATALPWPSAQKTVPFHASQNQVCDDGSARAVHVIPSGEVAAAVVPIAMAQNSRPFQAMDVQYEVEGSVRVVQVIPSGEVVALFDPDVPWLMAQKTGVTGFFQNPKMPCARADFDHNDEKKAPPTGPAKAARPDCRKNDRRPIFWLKCFIASYPGAFSVI
jgi:hypothetical protein